MTDLCFENDNPGNRTTYNSRIQAVQRLGLETEVEARRQKDGTIWAASFYVLQGDQKVLVGEAIPPFQEHALFHWHGKSLMPVVNEYLKGISGT